MSDRIYLVCNECEDKRVIAKRFCLEKGWKFFFAPDGGVEVINAESEQELKAQFDVGGLNCKEKVMLLKVISFNKWIEKHKFCNDFGIEMDV